MIFIPKLAIVCLLGVFSSIQVPAHSVSTAGMQQGSQTQEFSILERTDPRPPSDLAQTAPIVRVAQLPQLSSPPTSSRRVVTRQTNEGTATPPIESKARFELKMTGPDLAKSGELQTFKIHIFNRWPSNSFPLDLQLGIPPGFQFADSDIQAKLDSARNVVSWSLDSIPASSSVEINFRSKPIGAGPQLHLVNLIQDHKIHEYEQLETFVLTERSVVKQLPGPDLPQELPPIVQADQRLFNRSVHRHHQRETTNDNLPKPKNNSLLPAFQR